MCSSATSSRALALCALLAAATAEADAATVERRLGVMGTSLTLEVTATGRTAALAASEAVVRAVEDAERRLSTWRDDTELARLNRTPVGQPFELSDRTREDLAVALSCAAATGGAFDPTVGALVDAWGLRGAGQVPDDASLERARARTGHALLELRPPHVTRRAELRLEEGGFGKGAALDWAARAFRRAGGAEAVIDLGGQLLVLGRESVVGIAHPTGRESAVLELVMASGSLSTTGNSERGLVVGGRRLGHVLDARTGRPAPDVGSVTVVAPSAAWADCLSTALYVLGPAAALEWVRDRRGVEVVVLELTGTGLRARASAGLRGLLRPAPGATVQLEFVGDGEAR